MVKDNGRRQWHQLMTAAGSGRLNRRSLAQRALVQRDLDTLLTIELCVVAPGGVPISGGADVELYLENIAAGHKEDAAMQEFVYRIREAGPGGHFVLGSK